MDYNEIYERWVQLAHDPAIKRELVAIEDNELEKESRFGASLTFGTAGLRGILGAGTNRMNIYTVRRATQGMADYIKERFGDGSVAIAYDSRNMSRKFGEECASVLAANGITAYIYDSLMPTPMLSFAVRELGARTGIMITASHNPAEYNGYKAYGEDGCQMTSEAANSVYEKIQSVDEFDGVKYIGFAKGLLAGAIKYIDEKVAESYYEQVLNQQINAGICKKYPVKLVYSPLNGTGNKPVRRILSEIGVSEISIVREQELPDGNFPTCTYPNPETKEALKLGLELCEKEKPDMFIATDPDADRVGVAFKNAGGGYTILSGNEIGVLLLDYIIKARRALNTMPKNPVAVESIVSTAMAADIARKNGVEMRTVLTGFKYIGEQILHLERQGQEQRFIFGFEESCGYLSGSYVRDKDAVFAAMILCEMTSFYKSKNTSPIAVLDALYEEYGYYRHRVLNFEFGGIDGQQQMAAVMDKLFANNPKKIAGFEVCAVSDYKAGVKKDTATGKSVRIELPEATAIEFELDNGASVMVRPSGTEPKMKLYMTAKEKTEKQSQEVLSALADDMKELLGL
ncbi:MAG: phospho-sugar mutase [Oscillospiraceae bacterium]